VCPVYTDDKDKPDYYSAEMCTIELQQETESEILNGTTKSEDHENWMNNYITAIESIGVWKFGGTVPFNLVFLILMVELQNWIFNH